jgi:N utilization substance protein A
LASKLTGYEIDVYRNQAQEYEIDDVDLEEFGDEIEPWVIEAFKNIGCDTARQVLELSAEELIRRTDLEEETVRFVLSILAAEFEEGGGNEPKA